MPTEQNNKLRGLPGLNSISDQERQTFMLNNADKLKQFRSPGKRKRAAEILYNNQQFINQFGQEAFDKMNDGSQAAYDYRNNLLKEKVVDDAFKESYSPFDANGKRNNNKGFGKDWETYYHDLSTDAKLELLNSDWKTPEQLKKEQEARTSWWEKGIDFVAGEAIQQYKKDSNQKILDRIYNNDADAASKHYSEQVSQAYLDPTVTGRNDAETKKLFIKAITPDYANGNMGISEYASHYGNGTEDEITSEMDDFSIDDMRQVLAKKAVYDANMSPQMASTALNNEAKRYIKQHQGSLKRFGLFARDVGISAMSYTADKVNGIYNLGLMAADKFGDKPIVYVDDQGNIVDTSKTRFIRGRDGVLRFQGADGQIHSAHQQEIDRTTLHNMGKNLDGSDDDSLLNPQYWTRAEQFGTLDEDKQKQYEKLGSSPYKVAYNPNEDSDLVYESFKMMSFGIADAASMLIPFGVGAAGKALSTAGKIGNVGRAFGRAMNYAGRALGAETRFGQASQGLAGAGGIAYAYQRGAFQETLAQNLANAEEALKTASQKDIYNQYQNDKAYKQQIDSLVNARAASMKADYIANMGTDNGNQIADEEALNKMIHARAQEAVLGELVQDRMNERRSSKEFADLQKEAINSAGDAAITTFLPEAIKYGVVNTIGFRKFLYSHPTSLTQKAARNFEGITERTLEGGAKRLGVESKFATRAAKMKQMGKVVASQMWGGAWTNGTDDMMVDAAERINTDSYNRYLNAYENGEAIADLYGFTDGLYSYWKGLQNSLGQETTWNATAVGGLGGTVSASPHMANIAHLATKEGRQAFKENFQQRIARNEDGTIKRGEDGKPIIEDVNWTENWRDRAAFFIQNGVLNTYYGNKQNERVLQQHADYVNKILDEYEDFKVLEDVITSDIGEETASNEGDKKTMRFVKAMHAVDALNHLAQNEKDPAAMSSVVDNAKNLIATLSDDSAESLDENTLNTLLTSYYVSHPNMEQSEENNARAVEEIIQNAKKLQEAAEAYDNAETEIQKIEKSLGRAIDPIVRGKMKVSQALDGHWKERRNKMQDEIGDTSTEGEVSEENLIPSVGGRKNAEALVKVYDKQRNELQKELDEQMKETEKFQKEYDDAIQNRKVAQNSDEEYTAQKTLDEAKAKLDDSRQQESYLDELITRTNTKQANINKALKSQTEENSNKVLTSDEIFALDPVTRARMMSTENRGLYSKEQQAEIAKLEKELLMKDGKALEKVQDIALLTQRIAQNADAYSRMAKNPEAAAVQLESQRAQAADAAYKLINQRNAETITDYVNQFIEGLKGRSDVNQDFINDSIYRILRNQNKHLLDIVNEDGGLSEYQKQLDDAIAWAAVTDDIDAVVEKADESKEWKENIKKNIENVIESATDKKGIMSNLEKVIDDVDNPQVVEDFEKILKGLEDQGYVRDAAVIESRKQRKEREEAARKKIEEDKKKAEEAAKQAAEAAAKKAEEDAKIAEAERQAREEAEKNAAPAHEVKADGSNLAIVDTGQDGSKARQIGAEDVDLGLGWGGMVSMLMEDDAEPGDIDAGEIWYEKNNHPQKGNLTVTLIQRNQFDQSERSIRFSVGNERESITVYSDSLSFPEKDSIAVTKTEADSRGINDETIFSVNSIEKINGKWYFSGTFANSNMPSMVKVSDTFDLQNAINVHKQLQEAELASKGVDTENPHLIDEGNYTYASSPTIEEQAAEGGTTDQVATESNDAESLNASIESANEIRVNSLSGNAMSSYQHEALAEDGRMVPKIGSKANDSRNNYNSWMEAAGIYLQNIIDTELHQILVLDPHTKVKFMAVRPDNNGTHDNYMQSHLMLVVDYTSDVASIHNEDNGGVIESDGKKYLVIGTAGYGNINTTNTEQNAINHAKRDLYDILFANNKAISATKDYGIITKERKKFFDAHPNERFYVHPTFETEIIPNSLVPGYLVRQMENDDYVETRPISEILADEERNPQHLELGDLTWGIQELTQFLPIGENVNNIMVPRNSISNSGSVFVLIPASNGKMLPVHIEPLFFNEMNDGGLKDRVDRLLTQLTSPKYTDRRMALNSLLQIFHLDKEGNNILIGKEGVNAVSLVKDGNLKPFATFKLDSTFDIQKFREAFAQMNPRVNITSSVLRDKITLQEYDEAGALQTDCALLHTVGSSYSIYAVDANGRMMNEDTSRNNGSYHRDSDFRNTDRMQVYYKGSPYHYDVKTQTYSLNGTSVTDETTIKALDYNRRIALGELTPSMSSTVWDYYILETGEHPKAIKVHKNDKSVVEATEEEAQKMLDTINKEAEAKAREEAAKKQLEQTEEEKVKSAEQQSVSDVDLGNVVQDNSINKLVELYELYASLGIEDIQGELNNVGYQMVEIKEAERIFNQKHPNGIAQITEEEAKEIAVQLGINDYNQEKKEKEEKETPARRQRHDRDYYADKSVEGRQGYKATTDTTQTFEELTRDREWKYKIFQLLSDKFEDSPIKMDDKGKIIKSAKRDVLTQFLKEKKIEVDAIGTSKADIDAWLKTIEECR